MVLDLSHQSMVADPQCCGKDLCDALVFAVQSFFPFFFPHLLLVVAIIICKSPEVSMALPAQPSHWGALPCAHSCSLAVLGGLGGVCSLRWLVGNDLQPLSSIPDASPLHRLCAVFGTQLCFVNTE